MQSVNRIELRPTQTKEYSYLEIFIDGKRLSEYFVGRQGAHPGEVSPLGWSSAGKRCQAQTFHQFLLNEKFLLPGDRNPVLICESCGDIGCGAYTVRMRREGEYIYWEEWRFETSRVDDREAGASSEEPEDFCQSWPERPPNFCFKWAQYQESLRKHSFN